MSNLLTKRFLSLEGIDEKNVNFFPTISDSIGTNKWKNSFKLGIFAWDVLYDFQFHLTAKYGWFVAAYGDKWVSTITLIRHSIDCSMLKNFALVEFLTTGLVLKWKCSKRCKKMVSGAFSDPCLRQLI